MYVSHFQGCEEMSLENMKSVKLIHVSDASSQVVTTVLLHNTVLLQCYNSVSAVRQTTKNMKLIQI